MVVSKHSFSHKSKKSESQRHRLVVGMFGLAFIAILARLFYWQVITGSTLKAEAQDQYLRSFVSQGDRGKIYTSDGYLLAGNTTVYRLVAYPDTLENDPVSISQQIAPLLLNEDDEYQEASEEAKKETLAANLELSLADKLNQSQLKWISLFPQVSQELKEQLESLNLTGIDFEPFQTRFYPEASMAAHLTGFVAQNDDGEPTGYFGVEGALNKELSGKKQNTVLSTDGLGFSLFGQSGANQDSIQGRDVVLTIRRDLQFLAEAELKKGMERYGAKAGEIIILEPKTGQLLALASEPKYDQETFTKYDTSLYKNPAVADLFEPGSILKTLTVAIGIDTGSIEPDTTCPVCDGPRQIGKYTIRTWNDQYNPDINMSDALAKSDNTAMIYVAEQVGVEKFRDYLEKFGLGEETEVELHEDYLTPFPEKWGPVELATRSFGQGITVSSLQIVRAVAAIANHGKLMKPTIVEKVILPTGEELTVQPEEVRQVISPETAEKVTGMMIHAAKSGEAQWVYSDSHTVAAKTGTSQIPDEGGGYKDDATIATFIGFAPPEDPQFVMLVKLIEPQSSPWAAETAAPLWYRVAEKLFLSLNIPPDQADEDGL